VNANYVAHHNDTTALTRRTGITTTVAAATVLSAATSTIIAASSALTIYEFIADVIKSKSNSNSCTMTYGTNSDGPYSKVIPTKLQQAAPIVTRPPRRRLFLQLWRHVQIVCTRTAPYAVAALSPRWHLDRPFAPDCRAIQIPSYIRYLLDWWNWQSP
jgi:hypothetical protein